MRGVRVGSQSEVREAHGKASRQNIISRSTCLPLSEIISVSPSIGDMTNTSIMFHVGILGSVYTDKSYKRVKSCKQNQ